MEEFGTRYSEVMVKPENAAAARALSPLHERQVFGRSIFIYDRADRERLAELGEVRTPSLADLFVAIVGGDGTAAVGVAA
jgi:ABC-2 type transport system ATP-binding protein